MRGPMEHTPSGLLSIRIPQIAHSGLRRTYHARGDGRQRSSQSWRADPTFVLAGDLGGRRAGAGEAARGDRAGLARTSRRCRRASPRCSCGCAIRRSAVLLGRSRGAPRACGRRSTLDYFSAASPSSGPALDVIAGLAKRSTRAIRIGADDPCSAIIASIPPNPPISAARSRRSAPPHRRRGGQLDRPRRGPRDRRPLSPRTPAGPEPLRLRARTAGSGRPAVRRRPRACPTRPPRR